MSSFAAYVIGFAALIAGLGLAAYLLNVPGSVILGVVIVLGWVGLLRAKSRMRKDSSAPGTTPPGGSSRRR